MCLLCEFMCVCLLCVVLCICVCLLSLCVCISFCLFVFMCSFALLVFCHCMCICLFHVCAYLLRVFVWRLLFALFLVTLNHLRVGSSFLGWNSFLDIISQKDRHHLTRWRERIWPPAAACFHGNMKHILICVMTSQMHIPPPRLPTVSLPPLSHTGL